MKYLFLCLSFFLIGQKIQAQSLQQDSVLILRVIHEEKGKARFIYNEDKVIFKLKGSEKVQKGWVEYISEEGILISDSLYQLADFDMLMSKTHRSKIRLRYGLTAIAGGIVTAAGVTLIAVNEGISPIVGIVGVIAGIPTIVSGIIPFFKTNHYSRKKGWNFEILKGVKDMDEFL